MSRAGVQETPTHVYVIGFSDDIVKIGRTANPDKRLQTLKRQGLNRGASVTGVFVAEHSNCKYAESHLRFFGRIHYAAAKGTEYFRADFDSFMSLLVATYLGSRKVVIRNADLQAWLDTKPTERAQ